jgi:predicted permease
MAVVSLELPLLILVLGIVCAFAAWLLATFTAFLRGHRYRVSLGLIAFPLSGLMGFISTLNAINAFGDWLASKPLSFVISVGCLGYLVFGFLGCWTAVRVGGRMDRKHTLSVLYNLVKEHKERENR